MAPALRMTRSIKEKLPVFFCLLQVHIGGRSVGVLLRLSQGRAFETDWIRPFFFFFFLKFPLFSFPFAVVVVHTSILS
ncbi:hypothetical protein ASPWEDRAFT_684884 [Aspergillus wentii DTO 134E9]|uniref:Uncharacterized protein n=1 Tax=Aspergillus wentii DTO 134E9 TaxID=1073089 RepID=A0A1L9R8E8_ASPWE|nr:uncharacterized protein ASPWEDRAFT_684884 [Aspergillus wentii DTO 134E9]OJJ31168.1 hypothetical protein ASPWEDRAFT_684884 [Aspergillus wentii DTO 134E9]